jgi:hypothetical protein
MNRITWLTFGSLLVACSSSSNPPTREQYDDTAQAIASTTASAGGGGDVASMADSVTISLGAMPAGFSATGSGHFRGNRLGVDYDYAITCKNAAGATNLCGPTTDQASVDVSWSGTLDTANVDADVTRDGHWTVTGLQTPTATFNGDSTFSFDATLTSIFRPGVTATYSFDASASYDDILISTQQRKVTGGTATSISPPATRSPAQAPTTSTPPSTSTPSSPSTPTAPPTSSSTAPSATPSTSPPAPSSARTELSPVSPSHAAYGPRVPSFAAKVAASG